MTWEAKVEHKDCPPPRERIKQGGFANKYLAMAWAREELRLHMANKPDAPTETLSIAVTIKETCLHDKQALWVKAAGLFMRTTGGLTGRETDIDTYPAYRAVERVLDQLATCAKCGEAVA